MLLFIGYSHVQKRNKYLDTLVTDLQEIKFDIAQSALNFQLLLDEKQELYDADYFKTFNTDINSSKIKLEAINNDFKSHSINYDSEFNGIINDINSINETSVKKSSENILNVTVKLTSLKSKIHQTIQNKWNAFQRNALMLFVLIAVLFLTLAYFLAYRMTRDLNKLNKKANNLSNFKQETLVSNIVDITDLDKTLEALKSKLRRLETDLDEAVKSSDYKSVFLANMSYEIRTPLNSVLGMINMLKQSELTTEQQIQLEIAEYSSEHVLQLVNMILDNSKVEGGKVELELSAIDLKSDLAKLIKVFEYEAWDSGLEFEFKFLSDENQKFLLLGDIKRIKQILTNLLSNAIKFTNAGKVSLTIDQTVGPDDYQIVTFYVKDTGIGISPEKAKRIMSDSQRNHLSIVDYYGGTGLGLTASCQLLNLMGGELKLESKENEGSIFYFSIQLQKTLNFEREQIEPTPILLNRFDYKFTVLVAEDNVMNQKVIKFLLEQQGADCTFVKNGSDAVKLFNILDFDMVFMDIFMPEMDGYEATKLIKASHKYKEHKIPIIAVSASAFEEDIKNAKKAGIDDFLAKPIETEKLKELLVKYAPNSIES
ncbi:response regulator [Gaetbulibacter sp. M235]|uniref:response regulator n=1 Tax=Gaetbulibacter sp. M235 TaxID=3126510 RepID=UPI00374FAE2A